jgi:hypothetical protein
VAAPAIGWSALARWIKIMSKINDHAVTEKNRVEHLRVDGELTAGELEHVSGGKQGGPKVPAYMDVKLKEVLVTAV